MKKLLLSMALFGSLLTAGCFPFKHPLPPAFAPAPIVQIESPKQAKVIKPAATVENLDKRVTDIETRMAQARAYWAKHPR